MAARSMWNGVLQVGATALPVKLHAAVEDRTVRFHLLHDRDEQRVTQKLVHPETGEEIANAQIRRGYRVDPGVFVVLDEDEIAKLDPEPSRDIEITRFVPLRITRHAWYERPYYLSPDGDARAYFALAKALAKTRREGVARWVMRKRGYVGSLREEGGYLVLVSMRHAGEVVDAAKLEAPPGPALSGKELAMAEQLVSMLEGEMNLDAFHDEYRKRLEELIEAKQRGKVYRFKRPAPKRAAEDLEHALTASLAKLRRRSA